MPAFFLCFKVAEGELLARQMRALVDMENSGMVPMLQQVGAGLRLLPQVAEDLVQVAAAHSMCTAAAPALLAFCHLPGSRWPALRGCPTSLTSQPGLALQDKYGDLQRMYSLFRRVEGGHELLRKVGTHCHLPQGGGRLPLLPLLPALALLLHA